MKKKILFAIPTLGGGGAEKVLVTLLNNLDETKYDLTLFTMFGDGVNKKYLKKDIKHRTFFKKQFKGNIHILKLFSPKILYELMIRDEYDIAISYLEGPTTRLLSGSPRHKTKLLNWVHTEIHDPKILVKSYRNTKELIDSYNKFDSTVFVSNTAKTAFINSYNNIESPKLVKYNTIDTNEILDKSNVEISDVVFAKNKINIISVGRFTEQKGYIRLLRVWKKLVNENKNIHLYLLGQGALENKYYSFIEKNNLKNHVTILGFKDNPHKYVKSSDIFVCSSFEEGYSTAVSESIIIGTPVVTTLCSGMEEMLGKNNEYGLIVKNEENALYDGIRRMINNPELISYYRNKVKERKEFFSTEKTVKEVEEMLDTI